MTKTPEQINWQIHEEPRETRMIAAELETAIKKNNLKKIADIIKSERNIRSLIVRWGERGKYILLLRQAFLLLAGPKSSMINDEKISLFIEKHNFNPFFLAEMMAVAFHLRDTDLFYKILVYFEQRKKLFGESEAYLFALNAFASWEGSVNNNHEKNLKLNKQILEIAREKGTVIMEQKAKFALSDHKAYKTKKALRPSLRINDFNKMAKIFRDYGIEYDALRAEMEGLDSLNNLIELTTDPAKRSRLIEKALVYGKQILTALKKIEYPTALIRLKRILSISYDLAGQKKFAARLKREAAIMEKKYKVERILFSGQ